MLPCRGAPFYFISWQSSLAWMACTLNPSTCSSLQLPYFPDFSQHAHNYSVVIAAGYNNTDFDAVDLNSAYTFCFWTTIAQAVPYLLSGIAVILLAIAAVNVPFQLAAAGMQCIIQSVVYTHIQEQPSPLHIREL
jgi:hypothetical protein